MNDAALVACTDPERRQEYVRALSGIVDRVYPAGDFETAKNALRERAPSLLVAEIRLREYNGLHLVLMAQARGIPIRAILIGEPESVLEKRAAEWGAKYLWLENRAELPRVVTEMLPTVRLARPRTL